LERLDNAEFVIVEPDNTSLGHFTQWLNQSGFTQEQSGRYVKSNSNIKVIIFQESIEEYLASKPSETEIFDLVLCTLFLHYVPYGWLSILRAMYDLLKPDGLFIVDRICGQDLATQKLLEFIDCDARQLESLDCSDDECLSWRAFYLNRCIEKGSYWGSSIKGTNIKLIIEALEPLFAEHNVIYGGRGTYELQDDHLPWWWASEQTSEQTNVNLPFQRPLPLKFEFHVFHRKQRFENQAALENHWNLVKKACILTTAQNFSAILWFLRREKAFGFQDTERFIQDILPSIVLQLVVSSGIIDYRHGISSIFISSGTLPSELGLPKLQNLFLVVSDIDGKGENRIQTWLRNYIIYSDILKAPLSEVFISSGKKVLLFRQSRQSGIQEVEKFGYVAIPVPGVDQVLTLPAGLSPPVVKQLLGWKLLQIDRQRGISANRDTLTALQEFVSSVQTNDIQEVPAFPGISYSHVQPLCLLMSDLGAILFIPIPTFFEQHEGVRHSFQVRSIMGIGVTASEPLSDEKLRGIEDIYTLVSLLLRRFQDNYLSLRWVGNLRRVSLRSAVAAIMARNMSHLLGSHIEPGIQNDLISLVKTVSRSELLRSTKGWPPNGDVAEQIKKVARYGWPQAFKEACEEAFRGDKDKYNLLELLYRIQQKALDRYALYRQRRMDFIARVATDWPAWGVGFDFYINFVRPFLANSILLHFVGYSDGVHLDWLDFDVHIGDSKVTERYTPQQGQPIVLSPLDMAVSWGVVESEGRARYSSRPHNYTPVTVWSRGGDMAVQAFHVILENIIRNSIKHCLPSIKSNKKLRIGIRLFQTYPELSGAVKCPEGLRLKASDDLVYVVISSDADCPDKATDLDQKICEPVTKETGEREPGNWGMKEIKIAAALLGNRGLEEVNNPNPDFVQICKVQMPKENGQVVEQLGYCLTLPRFYYVGILKQGAGDVVSASE
jgi:SAM-dependent methyltransferase